MRNYRGWSRTGKNENKLTVVQISNIQFNLLSTSSYASMIIRLGVTVAAGARRWAVIIVIVIVASASTMGEQKL